MNQNESFESMKHQTSTTPAPHILLSLACNLSKINNPQKFDKIFKPKNTLNEELMLLH